ncbi:helix-turn-helix domain-containing protein [Marinactinospora thermotolerans]|nr:helix-turn-helix transcriptional regulator [Marinactinospora thermotolerans]
MGQRKPQDNPALRKFGRELARLRGLADMSQERLGKALNVSGSLIGHYERAERRPSRAFTEKADEALNAGGRLLELWPKLRKAGYPEYAGDFLEAVPLASIMRDYHPTLIPGPLQTEAYAHATLKAGSALATEEEVAVLVAARMERQHTLLEAGSPAIWAIIDEDVIRRLTSDPDILLGQLDKLLELSESGRADIQIVPSSVSIRRHPGLSGPLTILSFTDKPDVVYVEGFGSGNLISDPETVEEISLVFGKIQAAAYPPEQTVDLLKQIRGEFNGTGLAHVQLQQWPGRALRGGGRDSTNGHGS